MRRDVSSWSGDTKGCVEQVDLAAPIYLEHADRQEQPVQEAAYVDYGLVEVKIVRGIAVVFCVNTVLKRLFRLSSDISAINAVPLQSGATDGTAVGVFFGLIYILFSYLRNTKVEVFFPNSNSFGHQDQVSAKIPPGFHTSFVVSLVLCNKSGLGC